jgi:hypothetical protein
VRRMTIRPVSITDEVDQFLRTFERNLLSAGYPASFISAVAGDLLLLLFDMIPRATGEVLINSIDKCSIYPGNSLYQFTYGSITGVYSSSGDYVVLLSVDICRPALPNAEAVRRTSAA